MTNLNSDKLSALFLAIILLVANSVYFIVSINPTMFLQPQWFFSASLYRFLSIGFIAVVTGLSGSSLIFLFELFIISLPYLTTHNIDISDVIITTIVFFVISTYVKRRYGKSFISKDFMNFIISNFKVIIPHRITDILFVSGFSFIFAALLWPIIFRPHNINYLLILLIGGIFLNTTLISSFLSYYEFKFTALLAALFSSFGLASTPSILITASAFFPPKEILIAIKPKEISFGIIRYVVKVTSRGFVKKIRKIAFTPLRIDLSKLTNRHTLIIGKSGTGKSYLAKKFIKQLMNYPNTNILIVDPHGEYVEEFSKNFSVLNIVEEGINPLELMGKSPKERAYEISELLADMFNLGQIQKYYLMNLILSTYKKRGIDPHNEKTWSKEPPPFDEILKTAKELMKESEAGTELRIQSLIPYIDVLSSRVFNKTSISVLEILNKPSIIDLHKVSAESTEILFVDTLLRMIFNKVIESKGIGKELYVIVEEAHRFMKGKSLSILNKLLKEGRKYGINLCLITQQPLDLSSDAYTNSEIKIIFSMDEQRNLNYVANIITPSQNVKSINIIKDLIKSLPKGEAIIKIGVMNELYVIKI